jgi:hypothetical protein
MLLGTEKLDCGTRRGPKASTSVVVVQTAHRATVTNKRRWLWSRGEDGNDDGRLLDVVVENEVRTAVPAAARTRTFLISTSFNSCIVDVCLTLFVVVVVVAAAAAAAVVLAGSGRRRR